MWQAPTMPLRTQMSTWNGTNVCVSTLYAVIYYHIFFMHWKLCRLWVLHACEQKNTATLFQVWCNFFMISLYLMFGVCYHLCIQRLFCKQKRVLQFGSKLTLNNYLSVIFRDSCDLYIEPLILTQGFTSLR